MKSPVNQAWTNNGANTFTVSGLTGAGANTLTLDGSGNGLTTLTGGLSLSGAGGLVIGKSGGNGTTISGGTIALGGTGGLVINSGASAVTLGAATISADQSWINNSSTAMNASGILTLTNRLTLAGGNFTFSGANLGTGGIALNAGTLKAGSATALGASGSAVSVASGAVLDVNGWTMTNTNALSLNGTGIGGTGGLINSSNNTSGYAGAITLVGDSMIGSTGNGNTTTISGAITSTGTANLTLKAGGTQALTINSVNNAGTITNSGAGSGTVTLNATIGTSVTNVIQNSSSSILALNGTNPTWSGGLQINLGTIKTTGGNTTFLPTGNGTITLGNATTGGDAKLEWSANAQHPTNPITVSSGTGNRTLQLSIAGNTAFEGNITLSGNLTVDTAAGSANGFTLNGTIIGDATKKITFTNTAGTATATTTLGNLIQNSFTGVYEISRNATLATGAAGQVVAGTVNVLSGGNFNFAQGNTIAGLNGESGSFASGGTAKILTIGGSGNYTFAGVIQNTAGTTNGLTMNGTGGTQTLSGNNTYTNATTVNAGTLNLTGGLSGSNVTVNGATAKFTESSSGVISGSGTTFTLTSGNATLAGTNTYTGNTTIATGMTLVANNVSALGNSTFTSVKPTGTATLDLATDTSINAYNIVGETGGGNYTIISDRLTPGAGVTHTLGTLSMGNGKLNIVAGNSTNVTGGSPALAFGNVALSNGGGTSVTFNPTTASVAMVNVNMVSTANNQTLVLDGTATGNTISGVISNFGAGSGYNSLGLTKSNSSTWTVSGNNSYTGNTAINGGTLQMGNTASLGFGGLQTTATGTTTVNATATLDFGGSTNVNEPISISGTGVGGNGALVNNSGTAASIGSGIAGLAVAVTGSGTGFSTAPTVVIIGTGSGATATASLGVTAASFTINSGTTTYSTAPTVAIAGGNGATATATLTGGLVTGITITGAGIGFSGTPTITFTGGNATFVGTNPTGTGNSGNFTVGGLQMTAAGSGYTGTPTFTFDGSAATVTPTLSSVTLAADSSIGGTGDLTINAVVSGSKALTKVGSGTLTLTGANTYTGNTTISSGTLQFAKQTSLYNGTNASWTAANIKVASGGTLALNVGGASEFSTGNVTTLLTNLGGLGGAVSNNGLQSGSKIAFDTTGGNFTVANNIADSTGTGGGAIGLTKRGTNTLTLTGANTYTGATLVTSGTLVVNGSVGGGGITVQSGATLGGNITAGGTTTIQSGGTLGVGNSPVTGSFSTLNLESGGLTVMEIVSRGSAGIAYDTIGVSSALSYGGNLTLTFSGGVGNTGADFTLFTGSATKSLSFDNVYIYAGATQKGYLQNAGGVWTGNADLGYGNGTQSFTFTQSTGTLIVAVPEPATWALLAFSLTTVMVLRRRRNS